MRGGYRFKRRDTWLGFGDYASDHGMAFATPSFAAKMRADGINPILITDVYYYPTSEAEYDLYKSKGMTGQQAHGIVLTISLNKPAIAKALNAGMNIAVLQEAISKGYFNGGSEPSSAQVQAIIDANKPPVEVIAEALNTPVAQVTAPNPPPQAPGATPTAPTLSQDYYLHPFQTLTPPTPALPVPAIAKDIRLWLAGAAVLGLFIIKDNGKGSRK